MTKGVGDEGRWILLIGTVYVCVHLNALVQLCVSRCLPRGYQLCTFATGITFPQPAGWVRGERLLVLHTAPQVAGIFTLKASFSQTAPAPAPVPGPGPGPWHNRLPPTPPRWERVGRSPCWPREAMPRVSEWFPGWHVSVEYQSMSAVCLPQQVFERSWWVGSNDLVTQPQGLMTNKEVFEM